MCHNNIVMSQNQSSNDNNFTPKEPIIDFGALFNKYKRYWWMFAASLVACFALAVVYLKVKLPTYLVTSTILVAQDDNGSSAGATLLKSLSLGDIGGSKVDDEVVVMSSNELCSKMINKLKINRSYIEKTGFMKKVDHYGDSPIEIDAPNELFDTLSVSLKFKIEIGSDGKADVKVEKGFFNTLASIDGAEFPVRVKTPYGMFQISKTSHFKPGKATTINASVVGNVRKSEMLQKDMTIKILTKKSNAIYMDITETNTQRAKDILNTIMALYNERGQEEKNEMAVNTGKFIDERLGLIYTELTKSEADIEAYKKANKIYDVETQTKTLFGKQTLAEQQALDLETRYRIAEMVRDFISDPKNRNSYIPFSVDSTQAVAPIAAYNRLILERARLENSAKPGNMALREIDDQISAMRINVQRGIDNTLRAINIQHKQASSVDNSSSGQISQMPTQEREARNLYRQQGIQNTLYTFLLQKREENALLLAATTPKGKIVDHAFAQSEPVAPKPMMVAFVALVMGLLIPLAVLYIKNVFTTKFSTTDELQDIVQVPVIGEICHNRHHSPLVVKPGKTSSIVELFRLLRNNIQFMLPSAEHKVLLVTSSVSGEGKSFVSTNLAASFALLGGKKVALVGMDIRSPKLADMLGLSTSPGVTSYLAKSEINFTDVPQQIDVISGLDVLVGGPIPPNPSELLLSSRVNDLFNELRARYDVIVVDSAPIAMVSDTFSLVRHADAVVYVTRANYTKRSLIKYFNTVVRRGQLKNVAMVVNDSNPRLSQGYGYGYGKEESES